jgi:hypothetical protein
MNGITRLSRYWLGGAGVALTAFCIFFTLSPNLPGQAQDQQAQGRGRGRGGAQNGPAKPIPKGFFDPGLNRKLLPPGGPTPRTADGHPDLSGRYYPNGVGRMVGTYTPAGVDPNASSIFPPENPPQEEIAFRPETKDKYQFPTPYGTCAPGGTPTSITTQRSEHGPIELIQRPGVLWIVNEFPQTVQWIPTDGRPHSKDPDVSFVGEKVARWEGDTLVVDTVAIDTRMRNISVGGGGDANAWTHSEKEHVIERFSRPSKNFLMYQVIVDDPVVLAKPFVSPPMRWSLAQDPNDTWTEYLCTANEDSDNYQQIDPKIREDYEKGRTGLGRGGAQ